jgi:acetyl esterase/lipase
MRPLYCLLLLVFAASCKKETVDEQAALSLINVSYGADTAQKMDIYLPAGRNVDSTRLIVLVHGGAWSVGDKSDYASYIPVLKQRLPKYAIANINYRLATVTANPFPAQENDMRAALAFLKGKSGEYRIGNNTVLLGSSAGAHLALLQAYKQSDPRINAVISFFGPVDMVRLYNETTDPVSRYGLQVLLSGTPATNPTLYQQSSPINFVNAATPPTLLLHGTADSIVMVSHTNALQTKLQAMNIPHQVFLYPGLGHDFWPQPIMNDAFDRIEAFLRLYNP